MKPLVIVVFFVSCLLFACGESPGGFEPGPADSSSDTFETTETETIDSDSESTIDPETDSHFDSDVEDSATMTDDDSDSSDSGGDGDSEDESDSAPDLDTDSQSDTDSPSDTDSQSDTDSPSDTDSQLDSESGSGGDSDSGQPQTDCEKMAKDDPAMVCCGSDPPTDCNTTSWEWSPENRTYGCCTDDLSEFVYCEHVMVWSLRQETCPGLCRVRKNATDLTKDLECAPIAGYDCQHPVLINTYPTLWSGQWSDFGNTFTPSNSCGNASDDIWFQLTIQVGERVTVTETSNSKVVLRFVKSCQNDECVGYADKKPETMVFQNTRDTEWTVLLVVGRADFASTLSLQFSN